MRNMELYLVVSYTYNKKEKQLSPSKIVTIGSSQIDMYLFQKNMGLQKYDDSIFLVERDEVTTDVHLVKRFDGADSMALATIAFNDAAGYEFRSGLRKMIMTSSGSKCVDLKVFFNEFISPRISNIHDERSKEMAKSIVNFFADKTDVPTAPQLNPQPNQPTPVLSADHRARVGMRPDMMLSAAINEKSMVSDAIMRALERHHRLSIVYNEIHGFIQCNIYKDSKEMM